MSSLNDWIAALFEHPNLLRMGHGQRADDQNLGLGWLYYAPRPHRPPRDRRRHRLVTAALRRWCSPARWPTTPKVASSTSSIRRWSTTSGRTPPRCERTSATFGVTNITHHCMTTQEFVATAPIPRARPARASCWSTATTRPSRPASTFDAFADKLAPQGIILLHDSVWRKSSPMYGPGASTSATSSTSSSRAENGSRLASVRPALRRRPVARPPGRRARVLSRPSLPPLCAAAGRRATA